MRNFSCWSSEPCRCGIAAEDSFPIAGLLTAFSLTSLQDCSTSGAFANLWARALFGHCRRSSAASEHVAAWSWLNSVFPWNCSHSAGVTMVLLLTLRRDAPTSTSLSSCCNIPALLVSISLAMSSMSASGLSLRHSSRPQLPMTFFWQLQLLFCPIVVCRWSLCFPCCCEKRGCLEEWLNLDWPRVGYRTS